LTCCAKRMVMKPKNRRTESIFCINEVLSIRGDEQPDRYFLFAGSCSQPEGE
jgi:hypothetical protein